MPPTYEDSLFATLNWAPSQLFDRHIKTNRFISKHAEKLHPCNVLHSAITQDHAFLARA